MKIRSGFVSNSSSSSFVVIGHTGKFQKPSISDTGKWFVDGTYNFGWEWITYDDLNSRLAWAWMQAQYAELRGAVGLINMIKQAVLEVVGKPLECGVDIKKESWIDHQSVGDDMDMFNSMDELKSFIFDKGSSVRTGNDNEME